MAWYIRLFLEEKLVSSLPNHPVHNSIMMVVLSFYRLRSVTSKPTNELQRPRRTVSSKRNVWTFGSNGLLSRALEEAVVHGFEDVCLFCRMHQWWFVWSEESVGSFPCMNFNMKILIRLATQKEFKWYVTPNFIVTGRVFGEGICVFNAIVTRSGGLPF